MKKFLVVVIILAMLTSAFAGTVLADPDTGADKQTEKQEEHDAKMAEKEAAKEEREAKKAELKAGFEENKLARKELQTATKEQIKEQLEEPAPAA